MSKFNKTYKDFVNEIISEAYTPSNQIGIPTTGSPKWTWIWTAKMIIYHNTRNYNNFFQKWAAEFQTNVWNADREKIKNVCGKNIPMNLAIAKDDHTIYVYPNAIVDKIEDTTLHFHLDPKKYQEYKKYGYQIKTTNLQYWYNRTHEAEGIFKEIQKEYGVDLSVKDGIKMEDAGFYWYKVYGKEKGQLTDFYVRFNNVVIFEDLIASWDKLCDLFDQCQQEKREAERKEKERNSQIISTAKAILADKELEKQINSIRHTLHEVKKDDAKMKEELAKLDPETIERVYCYSMYRYWNYDDFEKPYYEYADDYRRYEELRAGWYSRKESNLSLAQAIERNRG